MNHDRRKLLLAGAATVCGTSFGLAADVAAEPSPNKSKFSNNGIWQWSPAPDDVCDYSRSFVTFVVDDEFNFARLQVESRTILLDREGKLIEEFFQFASCKSEDTHGTKDLFSQPNYDFSGVFSRTSYVLFRVRAPHADEYASRGIIGPGKGRFDRVEFDIRKPRSVNRLKSNAEIVRATRENTPLVGRTEIRDEASGRRAILEYPIKTMNVNLKRQIYQVDTGPLAFPDFKAMAERPIDMIELAYVAHNRPDLAYFVVQRPTPLGKDGGKPIEIYHYSETFGLPAKNQVMAVEWS